jgi:hypothetical protein
MPAFSSVMQIGGLRLWQETNGVTQEISGVTQEINAATQEISGTALIEGDAANGVDSVWKR